MTDTATIALITAIASLAVAFVSGGISLWNRSKTDTFNKDLEKLRAKLSHGQVISSTQWTAEFNSYQAIWKGMVAVRTISTKIVLREGELTELGLPGNYLASPQGVENWQSLIKKFAEANQTLLSAVHDTAPFYPEPIRNAANDTHLAAGELLTKHMSAVAHAVQGKDIRGATFFEESKTIVLKIAKGVDLVESLIRERLAAVEVVNSTQ